MKLNAGIIGGAGYTGGELIRLLINHPQVELSFIHSRSNAGKSVHYVHQDLLGDTDLKFTDDTSALTDDSIDVLFLCLGHGESKKFIAANKITIKTKIIDLANDFRLSENGKRPMIKVTLLFTASGIEPRRDQVRSIYCQPRLFCYGHPTWAITIGESRAC